jgi:hypothetical protein
MPRTEPGVFVSDAFVDVVPTGVDAGTPVTRDTSGESSAREGWQQVIDRQLIEWGRNPDQLEDEGVEPPAKEIIQGAILLARAFRDNGYPPPDSVVPDPNGGIVFERREQDVAEVFHLWDDGTVEYRRFHGTQLVERWTL